MGTQPATGVFTSAGITNTAAFRYVRYLSPNGGWGNVAELEFDGYLLSAPAPVPAGLSATPASTSQINLVWNVFSNTASYNIKRSATNGGPYTVIATGVTATNYPDSGLNSGTMYYYVVSAVVSGNETPNSAQATAATLAGSYGSLLHRFSFGEGGRHQHGRFRRRPGVEWNLAQRRHLLRQRTTDTLGQQLAIREPAKRDRQRVEQSYGHGLGESDHGVKLEPAL